MQSSIIERLLNQGTQNTTVIIYCILAALPALLLPHPIAILPIALIPLALLPKEANEAEASQNRKLSGVN